MNIPQNPLNKTILDPICNAKVLPNGYLRATPSLKEVSGLVLQLVIKKGWTTYNDAVN